MVAETRPYEEREENKEPIKVQCAKCRGVLFIAAAGFWEKDHEIEIKCRKCGFVNDF